MLRSVLASVVLAQPALAQERMTVDAFLDLVVGRTATIVHFGTDRPAGIEQFLRRDRSVFARPDGICGYGFIYEENEAICFEYDFEPVGQRHCWVPFSDGDRLLVATVSGSSIQEVTSVTDEPVNCSPPATS